MKSQKCADADTGVLSAVVSRAESECAVKINQRQTFPDVTEVVEAHGWWDVVKGVKENRCKWQLKSLRKLCPIAVNGVLRVGEQALARNLPFKLKHPTILPNRHLVTKLLVFNAHVQTSQMKIQDVLSILRVR